MTDRIAPDDPALLASVRLGEGLRLRAYPDPLSPRGKEMAKPLVARVAGWQQLSGAPWTMGYGHTGPDVKEGDVCTKEQADGWLVADLADAMTVLDSKEPWWRTMCAGRQRVLAEMCFNVGFGKLIGFHRMLVALQTQRFDQAADEMLDSVWAYQTKGRARRLADAMRAGSGIIAA